MTNTPTNAIPRRQFLLSTCLARTALGLKPNTGMAATAEEDAVRATAPARLRLLYGMGKMDARGRAAFFYQRECAA